MEKKMWAISEVLKLFPSEEEAEMYAKTYSNKPVFVTDITIKFETPTPEDTDET